jgi:hypothetical protein
MHRSSRSLSTRSNPVIVRRAKNRKNKSQDGEKPMGLTHQTVSNTSRSWVTNPLPRTQQYNGPIPNDLRSDLDCISVVLTSSTQLTTTASGGVSMSIALNPGALTDWSSFSALYLEARLIGARVDYIPIACGFATVNATTALPLVVYVDRSASTSIATTMAAAVDKEDKIITNSTKNWTKEWRMSGSVESQWLNTNAFASVGTVQIFGPNIASASAPLGYYVLHYLVQFRNRQ